VIATISGAAVRTLPPSIKGSIRTFFEPERSTQECPSQLRCMHPDYTRDRMNIAILQKTKYQAESEHMAEKKH
jgi:hypothetical protein